MTIDYLFTHLTGFEKEEVERLVNSLFDGYSRLIGVEIVKLLPRVPLPLNRSDRIVYHEPEILAIKMAGLR